MRFRFASARPFRRKGHPRSRFRFDCALKAYLFFHPWLSHCAARKAQLFYSFFSPCSFFLFVCCVTLSECFKNRILSPLAFSSREWVSDWGGLGCFFSWECSIAQRRENYIIQSLISTSAKSGFLDQFIFENDYLILSRMNWIWEAHIRNHPPHHFPLVGSRTGRIPRFYE